MSYVCNTEGCSLGDCQNCVAVAALRARAEQGEHDLRLLTDAARAVGPDGYDPLACIAHQTAALNAERVNVLKLTSVICEAVDVFHGYARLHRVEGTDEGEVKAMRDRDHAARLYAALLDSHSIHATKATP